MILSMPIDQQTQAWRRVRGHLVSMLDAKSGLTDPGVEAAESGELDPPVPMIEALAAGHGIPPGCIYGHPPSIKLLMGESDEGQSDLSNLDSPESSNGADST